MSDEENIDIDDLLRRTEGPPKKRPRLDWDSIQNFNRLVDHDEAQDRDASGNDENDDDESSSNIDPIGHFASNHETSTINDISSVAKPSRIFNSHFLSDSCTSTAPRPLQATTTSVSFESLGICTSLRKALGSMSIRAPTEVQMACIPPLLSGK